MDTCLDYNFRLFQALQPKLAPCSPGALISRMIRQGAHFQNDKILHATGLRYVAMVC